MRSTPCLGFTFILTAMAAWIPPSSLSAEPDAGPRAAEKAARVDDRAPLPSGDAAKVSLARVRDVFKDNYATAKSAEDKVALARQLLDESRNTADMTDRWSLLNEAIRLATEAGNLSAASAGMSELVAAFRVNSGPSRLDMLSALAPKASPQVADAVASQAMELAASFNEQHDDAMVSKSLALATGMAKKAQNKELAVEIQQFQSRIREEKKAEKELAGLLEKLKQNPDDPEVCTDAGTFLCLRTGDWEQGLLLLRKSADKSLVELAVAESRMGETPAKIIAAADGWADWGKDQKSWRRTGAETHAHELYARVVDSLNGLERTRIQKRMAALSDGGAAAKIRSKIGPRTIPGLVLWLDALETDSLAPADAKVARWKDLSGMGNDAVQPDESKRPARRPRSVEFDGNTFLVVPRPLNFTEMTIAVVYKANKQTADSALASTRTKGDSGWSLDHQGGNLYFRVFGDPADVDVNKSFNSPEVSRMFVASVGGDGEVTLDNGGPERATGSKRVPMSPSPTPLHVGAKTGDSGGTNLHGEMVRFIMYSRRLSAAEQAMLVDWLRKSGMP